MVVTVTLLCERSAAEVALELPDTFMQVQMTQHVAKFRETFGAVITLQALPLPPSLLVVKHRDHVVLCVCELILSDCLALL